MHKTNALRMLDKAKIRYRTEEYPVDEKDLSGKHVLEFVSLDADHIYKTLVLHGEKLGYLVICIPILAEIDLKKAAREVGDKKIEMLPLKDLLKVTGYMRGGCSPVGMKKHYPTFFDKRIADLDEVAVSAGIRGCQMILKPQDLIQLVDGQLIYASKDL